MIELNVEIFIHVLYHFLVFQANAFPDISNVYSLKRYDSPEALSNEERRDVLNGVKTIYVPEFKDFMNLSFELELFRYRRTNLRRKFNVSRANSIDIEPRSGVPTKERKFRVKKAVEKHDTKKSNSLPSKNNLPNSHKIKENFEINCDEKPFFWDNSINSSEIRTLQAKIMKKYINPSVDPCDDFYQFACGNWKKYYHIPSDRAAYDTFEMVRENLDIVIRDLLEDITGKSLKGAKKIVYKHSYINDTIISGKRHYDNIRATVKAKLYYMSCMRTDIIMKRGIEPLLAILEELGGWPLLENSWDDTNFDVVWLLAQLRLLNNDVLVSQWIGPDMKNSDENIIHIDQTSLGLPSREYYLEYDKYKYLSAYKVFILSTAKLMGGDLEMVEKDVDDLIEFEAKVASIMASVEERRNISETYLRVNMYTLPLYLPQFDWMRYFQIVLKRKGDFTSPVACYCVIYLTKLFYIISITPARVIQNYVIWRFVRHRTNNMDDRFMEIKQRFYYVLFGREKDPPRWQYCVSQVNANMGMAVGALFVEKYFDRTSRTDTIQMTTNLIKAFRLTLKENSWLDEFTKQYAEMKIDNLDLNIGFPDYILDKKELASRYSDVEIHPAFFMENTISILKHMTRLELQRFGAAVNRSQWNTPPAVVNAYYSRNKNQIMFPAGILQPPFYHRHFPKALNFGGIGIVIGHEITHGFDDKGRLFDHHGNFHLWWRDSSILKFYEKAQCLIDQYSQYVLPDIKEPLNGYLTQGENIADNGGLKQAYRAYETWLKNNPIADESLPGLNYTARQLFFLNFAQVWCGEQRPEAVKIRLKTSVHAPGIFRVIGVLSNSQEFSKAFKCPVNSPMNPSVKCVVW